MPIRRKWSAFASIMFTCPALCACWHWLLSIIQTRFAASSLAERFFVFVNAKVLHRFVMNHIMAKHDSLNGDVRSAIDHDLVRRHAVPHAFTDRTRT